MSQRRVLVTLCLTQITGWGVLFYAFPVLQGGVVGSTGWSAPHVAFAFTAGQLTAALGGVAVGRVLDRRGPRVVMTAGSVLAVGALVMISTAPDVLTFTLSWVAAGAAMAATLYGPAFAAITGWFAEGRRLRALTTLTVVGGLASTVFAPLTAYLHVHLDWRETYLLLAAVLALTVPLHWWGLRGAWPTPSTDRPAQERPLGVIVTRRFLVLAASLAITGLCATAAVVNLVPLLREQGMALETAGVVLALGGVGQVVGRLAHTQLATRLSPDAQTSSVIAVLAITTALLALVGATAFIVMVVLMAGAARGSLTLLRATAVSDRWGTRHYGQLTAALSLPVAVAGAAGPWVGAQLAAWLGGYAASFLALAALNAVAVLASLGAQASQSAGGVNAR